MPASRSSRRPAAASCRLRARRGVTTVIIALCALPLVGMLAFAVDVGMFYRARRNAQTAADAAALAWAHERYRGGSATDAGAAMAAAATANGYTDGVARDVVTAAQITWGASPNAVRVTVRDSMETLFAGVLGLRVQAMEATAVATYDVAASTACVHAVHPTATEAFHVQGNGDVNATGCGIQVNSTDQSAAKVQGNATINATGAYIGVTGGAATVGNATYAPSPTTGVPPGVNPLASVTMPTPGACDFSTNQSTNGTTNLTPAVYCGGLTLKGTVNFAPGVYFIVGGGMKTNGNATLNGTGVTFVNTARASGANSTMGAYDIGGTVEMNLSADLSSSAPMKGILFYQDPTPTTQPEAKIRGNSTTGIKGMFYLPAATIDLGGNGTMTIIGGVVASKVKVFGSGDLNIPKVSAGNAGYFTPKRVTLVD